MRLEQVDELAVALREVASPAVETESHDESGRHGKNDAQQIVGLRGPEQLVVERGAPELTFA